MKLKCLSVISLLTLSMFSCIDQSWDLSKIKNDEILLFTEGVSLPGGNFETIRFDKQQLEKLLPDMKGNLVQRGNQMFIEYVTDTNRISTDEMKAAIFDQITFGKETPLEYPINEFEGGMIPAGTYKLTTKEVYAIDPEATVGESIKRLDLITLIDGFLKIDISQAGIMSQSAEDQLQFEIKVPSEITIKESQSSDYVFENGVIRFSVPFSKLSDNKHAVILIPVSQIDNPLNVQPFIVESSLVSTGIPYNAGANITVVMGPQILEENMERIEGKFSFQFDEIQMPIEKDLLEQLYDAFGDEAVIDFYQPQLLLKTNSSFTVASDMDLSMHYQLRNEQEGSESVNVALKASGKNIMTETLYHLGTRVTNDPVNNNYTYDLTKVLKEGRRNLTITAVVKLDESVERQVLYSHMEAEISAVFETPFVFGKDLKADINEQKEEVFDQKTIDLLFSAENSEVYIDALVTKDVPLNIKLDIDVLDENNQPVGVQIADVLLSDTDSQQIEFIVSKEDAPKMIRARNLLLKGNVFTDESLAGKVITVDNFVDIKNLKIRKKGGVIIKP